MLRLDTYLQRLVEQAEARSQRLGYPQNPSLFAYKKVSTQAARMALGSGNMAGSGQAWGGEPKVAAAAHRLVAGNTTRDTLEKIKEAILDVHQVAFWDRRDGTIVKHAISQWAVQLSGTYKKAELEYRQAGGEGEFAFDDHLVDDKLPDYVVRKMQQANNIAAVSQSGLDKMAARMGGKQPTSDMADSCPHSSLGRSAYDSQAHSPRHTRISDSRPQGASQPYTHKMRMSKELATDVAGVSKHVTMDINQLLRFKGVSANRIMYYMKFEFDGGYAGS